MGIVFPKKVRGDSSRDLLQDVNNTQFNCDGQSSPLSTTQLQRPDGQSHLSSIEPARHLLSVVTRLYKSPVSLLLRASRKKLLGRKNCTQQHCCSCQELISHYSDNCCDLTDLDSCNERGELWQCSAIEDRIALTSSSSLMFDKEKNTRGSRESPAFVEKSNGAAILRCDMQPCCEKVDGAEKVGRGPTVIVESSVTNAYRQFTFHELSVATSKFSQRNLLGKGSSGIVFRGKLLSGGRIAVKCLSLRIPEAKRDFVTQLEIMSTVKSPHIVPLLGYAVEDDRVFLVYKYVNRGNLEKRLHAGKGKSVLSWSARCRIAFGIAKALKYLHFGCKRPIIHRDVKAANILLSRYNKPKLSDFGLAMWAPQSFRLSADIMGTFGYLAPEYFQFGKISKQIDVYAFGVVMLELITGRRPIDPDKPYGEENLVLWARPLIYTGCSEGVIDPRIKGSYCSRRMQRMLYTAALCVHPSDTLRPSIQQALHLLQKEHDGSLDWLPKIGNMDSCMVVNNQLFGGKGQMEQCQRERHLALAMAYKEDGDGSDNNGEEDTATTSLLLCSTKSS